MQAGAAGFLYKDVDPDALVRAIRSVHDGHTLLAPEVAGALLRSAAAAPAVRGIGALTGREREVLAQIAQGRSNREIARLLQRVGEDGQDPRQLGAGQARRGGPDPGRAARGRPCGQLGR